MFEILEFALKEWIDMQGKGINTQSKGMASAQILRLSYEHRSYYLSLSICVCSLKTKMFIK